VYVCLNPRKEKKEGCRSIDFTAKGFFFLGGFIYKTGCFDIPRGSVCLPPPLSLFIACGTCNQSPF
jgi:hypothetical protein